MSEQIIAILIGGLIGEIIALTIILTFPEPGGKDE